VDAAFPLVYVAGYGHLTLVAAHHVRHWTITVSDASLTRVLPRRWLDIAGRRMVDVWESACRAVVGVILFRPGIPQVRTPQLLLL
jgi:hypothetical protein